MSLDSGTTHTSFAFSHNHCQLVLFTEIAIKTYIKMSTETPNQKKIIKKQVQPQMKTGERSGLGKTVGKAHAAAVTR